jgi:hypothetical protein
LGQQELAIESFREVFRVQRQQPGHITDAHLDFGWLCISVPITQFYLEVLGVLDEFQYAPVFPIQIYRDAAIRAVIHHSRGQHQLAGDYAKRALSSSALPRSPVQRHPTLGVVTKPDSGIHAQLKSIVA